MLQLDCNTSHGYYRIQMLQQASFTSQAKEYCCFSQQEIYLRCYGIQMLQQASFRLRLQNNAASASQQYFAGATEYRCFSKQALRLRPKNTQNTAASASKQYFSGATEYRCFSKQALRFTKPRYQYCTYFYRIQILQHVSLPLWNYRIPMLILLASVLKATDASPGQH